MGKTIAAIGEALWDVFPDGRRPGGAPCNVAFHAARLGDRGVIVTRVGDDAAGAELVAFLGERGVATDFVQRDATKPSGTVMVTLDAAGPRYTITEDVAWDHIAVDDGSRALARTASAICVGSLAQRNETSRTTIQQLLSDARGQALVVFDVNLRPPFVDADAIDATFRYADVVKMSESEVTQLSTLFDRPSLITWLIESTGVSAVCVTRGRSGASITTPDGTVSASGIESDTSVGDAVGAGDAFLAALVHQFVREVTPEETLHIANRYAALVATKQGAMPTLSEEELAAIGL